MAHKLLLADDSITIQKVVELVLAEEDFLIKSVSNGEEALNLLNAFNPDIVLADIEMPRINGYNLCEKIKNNPSTSHVPVILLAGAFEPIDEELAGQVGADDFVIKPFESQELISKLNAALTVSSSEHGQEAFEGAGEEEILEAVEANDDFVVAEEAIAETDGAEGIEEDLWSMEEVPEVVEAFPEDQGIEEAFEIMEDRPMSTPEYRPELVMEEERASRPAAKGVAVDEADLPTKEEFLRQFEKIIDKKVTASLAALDMKDALLAALMPSMKDMIEKVLWEVAPELAEKALKEILGSSVSSLSAEVEKVIWDTVPDLAQTMISREIEKIKSEF